MSGQSGCSQINAQLPRNTLVILSCAWSLHSKPFGSLKTVIRGPLVKMVYLWSKLGKMVYLLACVNLAPGCFGFGSNFWFSVSPSHPKALWIKPSESKMVAKSDPWHNAFSKQLMIHAGLFVFYACGQNPWVFKLVCLY
ncbi:hypothetical protein Ddc_17631 [Ditylenchus destructor]|nr:hypothetical protein Ddc_17631 [Ditylenchus destructor]